MLERVLRSNLIGSFLATKHFAPLMNRGGGGRIILYRRIRGLRLDAARDRGVTETAARPRPRPGRRGCDVALCLRRDVPAFGQEPQHKQRFADEREGGDIDGVARYEQCAGAADQVAGAGDDEQNTENPGNIA